MFDYTICNMYDKDIFEKQCAALENKLIPLEKEKMLTDVDSSQIQIYHFNGHKIKVKNDFEVDAVYIESEIELTKYFN